MTAKIRYPNITSGSYDAQLMQVKSYLHQLADQLNIALSEAETATATVTVRSSSASATGAGGEASVTTFNSIKALIIKSADIVNAYYEEISRRLEGEYVAQSVFGTYTEETAQTIRESSSEISRLYENIQQITTDIEGVAASLTAVNAHIKSGLLYYDESGVPVYGVEVGQRTEIDGEEVFNKYARFVANKLSFYDQNGNEVAYISDQKLFITHVEITGTYKEGGFLDAVQSDGSVVTKWVGPEGGT